MTINTSTHPPGLQRPEPSSLQNLLTKSSSLSPQSQPSLEEETQHLENLALQIAHNLKYQHSWTSIRIHYESTSSGQPLPRPLISGLPPKRLYIHPDEQIELLQIQAEAGLKGLPHLEPEREWVLPSSLREKWSLRRFGEVFDCITAVPGDGEAEELFEDEEGEVTGAEDEDKGEIEGEREGDVERAKEPNKWRITQPKRVVMAILDDDSTVVYYIVHDGVVKPRQN
jgi:tRNA-splicing endonuclease subunit Sen15, fungi type